MNRIIHTFLALIMLLGTNTSNAQRLDYKTDSGFDIGFGIGGSYQQSDVRNSVGSGLDFTFGHSIYQREQSVFSLDWRFRFLAGQNQAFDDRINLDGTFNNVEYSHLNLDLELVLTLNRLRNRTGIILSGLAGGGLATNQTRFDYYDESGSLGSDDEFETKGINHSCFTPTFGAYIGYQFSKRFSMGVQHKTNLFFDEGNSTLGANIDGVISQGSPIDKNHYTTLVFLWDIRRKQTNSVETPCNAPIINFHINETSLTYATHELQGTIANVKNRADITVTIDGKEDYSFNFLPSTNRISAGYKLSAGTHTIIVTAKNECGQDSEIKRVVIDIPCDRPIVNFRLNEVNYSYATHELTGIVENVNIKSDINLKIDGRPVSGFRLNPSSGRISASFELSSGTHSITVTANNECGQDSETKRLVVGTPCVFPEVSINVKEVNLSYASHELSGRVANVGNKSDISVKIDGRPITGFRFNSSTKRINANIELRPGTHSIVVTAANECGQDSERISVVVGAPCELPKININVNEVNYSYSTHELIGTVTNIGKKSEISVRVDGRLLSDIQFTPTTKRLRTSLKLTPGTHRIVVTAINGCGKVSETETVVVNAPCNLPVVNFNVKEVNLSYASHELTGSISNVRNKSDITVKIDGRAFNGFSFVPGTKRLNAKFKLSPGTHTIIVTAKNECGQDAETKRVTVSSPCVSPVVNFNVNKVNRTNASHELTGSVANVRSKSDITVKIDGRLFNGFSFNSSTKRINASFKLTSGKHTIIVTAKNECGQDTETKTVTIEDGACGPRINPGSADWQFCLVTPRGTYNRKNLSNSGFRYSGKASSLFFKAIAGGSSATVNGRPYTITPGKYYLFTGNISVTVSTKNPGSMGHWSVCINADRTPQSGTGNNRPKSPCEGHGSGGRSGGKVNNGTRN